MKKRPHESLDSFGDEGEVAAPQLSIVEWPAGQDPLAEFTAEETANRAVPPPERVVPFAPPETVRLVPAPVYSTPRPYRTSGTPRTLFALTALATVAVISVWTLDSLSKRATLDTPVPTDVVAADQPALPSVSPAVQPVPEAPPPVVTKAPTSATPATESPGAETRAAETRTAETRRAAPPGSEPPRAAVIRTPPARTATPERVSEPRRPIDLPTRESAPVQAAVPAPATTRAVDALPAPVPAATATTGVRTTESVQGPRLEPPPVAVTGAAASAPPVAGPPPAPSATVSTAVTPPAPPAPAPSPVPAARVVTPTDQIQLVLSRYASAFSALDASRAKAVWPSVNERNLARAFESLEQQEFNLGACAITVTAPSAVASCSGTARYTPKVGNRTMRTESRQWTFRLEARGEAWSIASVESR